MIKLTNAISRRRIPLIIRRIRVRVVQIMLIKLMRQVDCLSVDSAIGLLLCFFSLLHHSGAEVTTLEAHKGATERTAPVLTILSLLGEAKHALWMMTGRIVVISLITT